MVKNTEQQEFVDRIKWTTSIANGRDMSGNMNYCNYCKYAKDGSCTIEQNKRVEISACAKAFNQMKKGNKSKYFVDWSVIALNEQKGVKDK